MNSGATPNEIDLDQAAAGMTLAGALLDAHGGVLLPQDTALTDSMLASLRRRGVQRCVVWCAAALDPVEDVEALDPAWLARERERRQLRLARLFRHHGAEPGGEQLLRVLRAYRERDPA
jgi:hypothetical protein